ncbi:MAG TPA: crossover junction endodeoxyribonuclease RuvC [Ferruginibacter sp.]|nr:crossover junction endodeoxyribonuclease RuvC [Ferruginibacter sp.]HMP20864.1 crossover junction endodeoxyribonuclease RuvC [Ferruginibacter sp.]
MQAAPTIVLGIDPGTVVMGYGLIKVTGNKLELLELDILRPGKVDDPYKKLHLIYNTVSGLIIKYKPSVFAIEAPFFGKNVQSMLKLGRAQGVAIAAAMHHGLDVTEYSPKKIKQSVTGNGNASKEQVLKMLQQLLQFKENPRYLDASDALAVAVCHYLQQNKVITGTKTRLSGWNDFIQKNPARVK